MEILKVYGKVFITGSYMMGITTWNDLDFYIENTNFSSKNYYGLSVALTEEMFPIRFGGILKIEKNLAFSGLETEITGERGNIDIYWKNHFEIEAPMTRAHDFAL